MENDLYVDSLLALDSLAFKQDTLIEVNSIKKELQYSENNESVIILLIFILSLLLIHKYRK
jgi:hypothetical protein